MKYTTLKYGGQEKKFEDWNFGHGSDSIKLMNQAPDTMTIIEFGKDLTDVPTFPFHAEVTIYGGRDSVDGSPNSFSGGTQEFVGKRLHEVVDARPAYEGVQYTFAGPWYDLENVVFQQEVGSWVQTGVGLQFQPELFLFTRLDQNGFVHAANTGEQITEVLQHLLDMYAAQGFSAPYQIGTIETAINFPSYIAKPMMCADVIQKCLEYSPDTKIFFDYSTTPPTVHVRKRATLTPMTLAFRDGLAMKQCRIEPRPDLQLDTVIIYFKITQTFNGQPYIVFVKDKYGPHGAGSALDPDGGYGVMIDTIDLQGVSLSTITSELDCQPVAAVGGTHSTKRAWWGSARGGEENAFNSTDIRFQDANDTATAIPDATAVLEDGTPVNLATLLATYPNKLVDGTVHPWMRLNNGNPVVAVRVKISAAMSYSQYDVPVPEVGNWETSIVGNRLKVYTKKDHHVIVTLTNGVTGYYSTTATEVEGEAVPVGMAQALYQAAEILQYEGDYIKVAASVSGGISMANNLNLSDGRAEWATMNSLIQSITKCLTNGTVEVSIGTAKHLNSNQRMALFRMWRNRREWVNPLTRQTGQTVGAGGNFELNKNNPKGNTTVGTDTQSAHMAVAPASGGNTTRVETDAVNQQIFIQVVTPTQVAVPSAGSILAKLSDLTGTNKQVKLREVKYKDANCNDKRRWVLCTDEEDDPSP